MANSVNNFFKKLLGKRASEEQFFSNITEELIPPSLAGDYSDMISKVLPYFAKLKDTDRQKFLHRVFNFKKIKRFYFHNMPESEETAVLVSASAVQVSFGLKKYLLPFFTDIYILSDSYQYKDSLEMFIGHVSSTGIYVSWKHFVQGFSDYADGMNVALHEMAHALHHENFIKENGVDWDFRKDFEKLPAVFGPLMTQVIVQKKSYLRGYAFTNFQEFWAVSV